MEFQKTINLLDTTSDKKYLPRLVTKTKVYNQSEKSYSVNKEIKIKTPLIVLSIKNNSIV